MRSYPKLSFSPLLIVLIIALLLAVVWANYQYVKENPGGNDFLVHWVGTRSLLIDGISPYTDAVALRIQNLAYGRPARPGEHELRVAYPLYSIFIFLPFALIRDYTIARTLWMTCLEIALIVLVFLCLRLTTWKPKSWILGVILVFSIFWYHGLRPLINGNAVILVILFTVGSLLAFQNEHDELAGFLLALATIKPHLMLLPILFAWFYAISIRRWKVPLWTIITLALLAGAAMIFVPNWILQNIWEILRYPKYNPPGTPVAVFSMWFPANGNRIGWILSAMLGLLLLMEWWIARGKEFRWFIWTMCLTLTVSQWIGIPTDPGNFILMYPSLILTFSMWEDRWKSRGRILIVAWLLILFIGLWIAFLKTVTFNGQPLQHPVMFFPLPFIVLIGLYWIRWWAIRPSQLLVEALRDSQVL